MLRSLSRPPAVPQLLVGTSIATLLLLTLAPPFPAAGEVIEGNCTGTVTMDGAVVIDAAQPAATPVEIPARGTARVEGSFAPETDGDPVPFRAVLRGQHAAGSWIVAAWNGTSTGAELVVDTSYRLPNALPPGSGPIPLVLDVDLGGQSCRIAGTVAVAGERFDVVTVLLLTIAALLLVASLASGRADRRGAGRPVIGGMTGLLAGVIGAAGLFGAGVIATDSNVWWSAPLLLAAVGLLSGALAPFRQPPQPDVGHATAPVSGHDEQGHTHH